MSRIKRNYFIFRYFPNISSDEFFNIGILLHENNKFEFKEIEKSHLNQLVGSFNLNKSFILEAIESLKNFLKDITSQEVIEKVYPLFRDTFEITTSRFHRSNKSFEEILKILYYDQISYKFETLNTQNKLSIVIEGKNDNITPNKFSLSFFRDIYHCVNDVYYGIKENRDIDEKDVEVHLKTGSFQVDIDIPNNIEVNYIEEKINSFIKDLDTNNKKNIIDSNEKFATAFANFFDIKNIKDIKIGLNSNLINIDTKKLKLLKNVVNEIKISEEDCEQNCKISKLITSKVDSMLPTELAIDKEIKFETIKRNTIEYENYSTYTEEDYQTIPYEYDNYPRVKYNRNALTFNDSIKGFLLIQNNNETLNSYALEEGKISIGRSENNDLIINDIYISRTHCELIINNNEIFLKDNNSTNGTYINNIKYKAKQKQLFDGDTIIIGKTVMKLKLL